MWRRFSETIYYQNINQLLVEAVGKKKLQRLEKNIELANAERLLKLSYFNEKKSLSVQMLNIKCKQTNFWSSKYKEHICRNSKISVLRNMLASSVRSAVGFENFDTFLIGIKTRTFSLLNCKNDWFSVLSTSMFLNRPSKLEGSRKDQEKKISKMWTSEKLVSTPSNNYLQESKVP